ncbi:MAG: hypothetical protein QM564_12885 [Bergeyella sp.]
MTDFFLEHIAPHIGVFVSAVLTGIAGFLFGKRKLRAEVAGMNADNEGKEIENAEKLVNLYKDTLDDLGNRYEVKYREVTALFENKIKLLEDEIKMHKQIINRLKSENTALRKKLKENGITP